MRRDDVQCSYHPSSSQKIYTLIFLRRGVCPIPRSTSRGKGKKGEEDQRKRKRRKRIWEMGEDKEENMEEEVKNMGEGRTASMEKRNNTQEMKNTKNKRRCGRGGEEHGGRGREIWRWWKGSRI